jgi:hypothetical protein
MTADQDLAIADSIRMENQKRQAAGQPPMTATEIARYRSMKAADSADTAATQARLMQTQGAVKTTMKGAKLTSGSFKGMDPAQAKAAAMSGAAPPGKYAPGRMGSVRGSLTGDSLYGPQPAPSTPTAAPTPAPTPAPASAATAAPPAVGNIDPMFQEKRGFDAMPSAAPSAAPQPRKPGLIDGKPSNVWFQEAANRQKMPNSYGTVRPQAPAAPAPAPAPTAAPPMVQPMASGTPAKASVTMSAPAPANASVTAPKPAPAPAPVTVPKPAPTSAASAAPPNVALTPATKTLEQLKQEADAAQLARRPGLTKVTSAVSEAASSAASAVNTGVPRVVSGAMDAAENSLGSYAKASNDIMKPVRDWLQGSDTASPAELAYQAALKTEQQKQKGPVAALAPAGSTPISRAGSAKPQPKINIWPQGQKPAFVYANTPKTNSRPSSAPPAVTMR